MNRLLFLALLAVVGAVQADPPDLSIRSLMQELKDNPKSLVMVKYEDGDFWAGAISEVGTDVFCVMSDMRKKPELRRVRCFRYSAVTGLERPTAKSAGDIMTVWVLGNGKGL